MLRIASKAETKTQFVEIFAPFCERDSFYIVTRKPKPKGSDIRFAIHLQNGDLVMSGTGTVVASHHDRNNPYKLPGMQLWFTALYGPSAEMIDRLVAAKASNCAENAEQAASESPERARRVAPAPPDQAKQAPVSAKNEAAHSEAPSSDTDGDVSSDGPSETAPSAREERVKGSDFILPANPFGELTDSVLEAFVECSMYEDANAETVAGQDSQESAELPSWWPKRGPIGPSSTGPVPILSNPLLTPPTPRPATTPGFPHQVSATPPFGMPHLAQPPGRPITANPLYGAGAQIAPPPAFAQVARPSSRVILTTAIAAAAVAAVISLLIGYVFWGGDGQRTHTAAASSAVDDERALDTDDADIPPPPPPAIATPAPAPGETAPGETAPGETAAQSPSGTTDLPSDPAPPAASVAQSAQGSAAADKPCRVVIDSDPSEAQVFLGERLLGETPLRATAPCGSHTITLKRARRAPTSRDVTLVARTRNQLRFRLERPDTELSVTSQPPGAAVEVDGKPAGETPVTLTVSTFRTVEIKVTKPGYRPYSKKLKPRTSSARVDARLRKQRRR